MQTKTAKKKEKGKTNKKSQIIDSFKGINCKQNIFHLKITVNKNRQVMYVYSTL
jgi:hypothetical protein